MPPQYVNYIHDVNTFRDELSRRLFGAFLGAKCAAMALELAHSAMGKLPLQERVRVNIRDRAAAAKLSQKRIADYFEIDPSAVSKLLRDNGPALTLKHVEGFSFLLQITPAELMIEPGALIQPLGPLEAAILDVVRKMDRLRQHSLKDVLEWQRASSIPSRRGRVDDLSSEDAMVLSLYRALGDSDAQAGIVMQMRGYVQARLEVHTDAARARKE